MDKKQSRETFVELGVAGVVGLAFLLLFLGDISEPLAMMVGGLALLAGGVYQTSKGWHVSLFTWILGLILTLGGLGVRIFLVSYVQLNWMLIAAVVVGVYLFLRFSSRRSP